ncbi:hypothetical protein O3P69_001366 [Scylla paramamosain]|uniref:Uncharacterized protein n=1 Tax=Scylla paramamosain TaxID=85552 RepID=A0AAW0UQM9_SCYPA
MNKTLKRVLVYDCRGGDGGGLGAEGGRRTPLLSSHMHAKMDTQNSPFLQAAVEDFRVHNKHRAVLTGKHASLIQHSFSVVVFPGCFLPRSRGHGGDTGGSSPQPLTTRHTITHSRKTPCGIPRLLRILPGGGTHRGGGRRRRWRWWWYGDEDSQLPPSGEVRHTLSRCATRQVLAVVVVAVAVVASQAPSECDARVATRGHTASEGGLCARVSSHREVKRWNMKKRRREKKAASPQAADPTIYNGSFLLAAITCYFAFDNMPLVTARWEVKEHLRRALGLNTTRGTVCVSWGGRRRAGDDVRDRATPSLHLLRPPSATRPRLTRSLD